MIGEDVASVAPRLEESTGVVPPQRLCDVVPDKDVDQDQIRIQTESLRLKEPEIASWPDPRASQIVDREAGRHALANSRKVVPMRNDSHAEGITDGDDCLFAGFELLVEVPTAVAGESVPELPWLGLVHLHGSVDGAGVSGEDRVGVHRGDRA